MAPATNPITTRPPPSAPLATQQQRRSFVAQPAPLLLVVLTSCLIAPSLLAQAGSEFAWRLVGQRELEREPQPLDLLHSSAIVGDAVAASGYASQVYNGRRGAILSNQQLGQPLTEQDLFQCVEPTRANYMSFVRTYNRSFEDDTELLERNGLFMNTLKRTILLNRIVQSETSNGTNYDSKPTIGSYHFIAPLGAQNVVLWYADITDCELGLIKYIVFNIIYHIDQANYQEAYRVAVDNSRHLPLLNADGFEQLANILLVRLFDRFTGEQQMAQLFQWPIYLKRLASYAYNRRQASQPDFEDKLALISYAYPAYFKDLKYNPLAVNRTDDNLRVHEDHQRFNKWLGRSFANNRELTKRLAIFRQRWSLIQQLNGVYKRENSTAAASASHLSREWTARGRAGSGPAYDIGAGPSAELRQASELDGFGAAGSADQLAQGRFNHTQFSDLTDAEFVAFLSNDFSLLQDNKESANYIDRNFPVRHLSESFKNELAHELELRRALKPSAVVTLPNGQVESPELPQHRANFQLARRVIDELIEDVGLPVGAATVGPLPEDEYYTLFTKVGRAFGKSYAQERASGRPNESEQADERQRRYDQFKLNYGRFKAWFIKEGWLSLDENQMVAMLRLADMSWPEIKLTLFKLCCLTTDNLAPLQATNTTLQYLGSNQFLCQPVSRDAVREQTPATANEPTNNQNQNLSLDPEARDLLALELYYYYTIHFNKHHSDMDTFNRKFAIFRNNIEQIRRHSCTRGLTIYESLVRRKMDSLNSIDTLDPRRSFTDDINLDRYKYFTVPNLDLSPSEQIKSLDELAQDDLGYERLRANPDAVVTNAARHETPTRAGITYRRSSFFSGLLDTTDQRLNQWSPDKFSAFSYPNKLIISAQNFNLQAQKYRQNSAQRVYELVMQRYRYCMSAIRKLEVNDRRQNCQASGALGEQSDSWAAVREQLTSSERLELRQKDQCAFYRMGLEAWDEGLIKQSSFSAQSITNAKCHTHL